MPGITIDAVEPDGNGGWYIQWTDPCNLDGKPLTAYYHLTETNLHELMRARQAVEAPTAKMQECSGLLGCAEGEALTEDGLPAAVAAWQAAYDEHLQDCIDRATLGLPETATHAELEQARSAALSAAENLSEPEVAPGSFKEFIRRRMASATG